MPVAEFDGDSALREIARLAWNLGPWIVQRVLPGEVVRWEWKRLRQAFVDAPRSNLNSPRVALSAPSAVSSSHSLISGRPQPTVW